MRRVLAPGGPLLLGIQEGDGEGWEPSPYAVPVERFFARYRTRWSRPQRTDQRLVLDLHRLAEGLVRGEEVVVVSWFDRIETGVLPHHQP
ncbi:MAG TPA: hypothetical protein VFH48_45415 [Chloroflexota bacterium]|nr:hypothetical protein [Chloroflexota bacterium]